MRNGPNPLSRLDELERDRLFDDIEEPWEDPVELEDLEPVQDGKTRGQLRVAEDGETEEDDEIVEPEDEPGSLFDSR